MFGNDGWTRGLRIMPRPNTSSYSILVVDTKPKSNYLRVWKKRNKHLSETSIPDQIENLLQPKIVSNREIRFRNLYILVRKCCFNYEQFGIDRNDDARCQIPTHQSKSNDSAKHFRSWLCGVVWSDLDCGIDLLISILIWWSIKTCAEIVICAELGKSTQKFFRQCRMLLLD